MKDHASHHKVLRWHHKYCHVKDSGSLGYEGQAYFIEVVCSMNCELSSQKCALFMENFSRANGTDWEPKSINFKCVL